MNKAQLVEVIAENADISKVKAGIAVDTFIHAVTTALRSGDNVTLIGFGSFSTVKRAARVGRNPKTGKEIRIPAKTVAKFKSGKGLKEVIAGKALPKKVAKAAKSASKAKVATKKKAAKPAKAAKKSVHKAKKKRK